MSKKSINAKIIDNIPFCGECGKSLRSQTKDCKLVDVNGEKYTEFIKVCSNKKCEQVNHYLADVTMDSTRRFVVEENNIKEIESEIEEG